MPSHERTSVIVNESGTPYRVRSVYNMDSRFWSLGGDTAGGVSAGKILSQPYAHHTWTYRSANVIATNVAGMDHLLYERRKGGNDEAIYEHEILELLKRPNPYMTEVTFWQAIILALLLPGANSDKNSTGGQCFIVPWDSKRDQKVNLRKGEKPDILMPYNGSLFQPRLSKASNGKFVALDGWRYEIPGKPETRIDFDSDEIIRIYQYNPYDILKGLAPYIPTKLAVDQDVRSDLFNVRLTENDGRVSGLLTSDQPLTQEEAIESHDRWMEMHGGPGRVGGVAVLGSGLKYQQFGLTKADMQYIESKRWSKDETIAGFGLNKIALGDYEKINFATIREGRKLLWYDTYLPLDNLIWDGLNGQWINYADRGQYYGASDLESVEALQADKDKQVKSGGMLVQQMGFPPALAASIVGINLSEEDIERWPHLNEPPTQPPPADPSSDSDGDSADKSVSSPTTIVRSADGEEQEAPPAVEGAQTFDLGTEEGRAGYSDVYVKEVLDPPEAGMYDVLRRHFYRQRNAMQDKVDSWLNQQADKAARVAVVVRSAPVNPELFLLDEIEEVQKLEKIYAPKAVEQMKLEAAQLEKELGSFIEWSTSDEKIKKFVGSRVEYMKQIETTTFTKARDEIARTVETGINEEWTTRELAKHLKETIYDTAQIRVTNARTIARTEMGSIASETRFDVFKTEGIDKWRWITARDDRVRDTHKDLDGQVAVVKERFVDVNGSTTNLRYPRDFGSGAEAGDVINCRCVVVAYFEDDE